MIKITKTGTHKIINILGIKIKFSRFKNNRQNIEFFGIKLAPSPRKHTDNRCFRTDDESSILPNGIKLTIFGENNNVTIHPNSKFKNTEITIGTRELPCNNCEIIIEENCIIERMFCVLSNGKCQKIKIGKNTTIASASIIMTSQSQLEIGEDCMISWNTTFLGHDGHTIIDEKTKEILNGKPTKISIGNHCWIGADVKFINNGSICENSIVGIGSIVNKVFSAPNILVAGIPAKIIRKDINWDRKSPTEYAENCQIGTSTRQ